MKLVIVPKPSAADLHAPMHKHQLAAMAKATRSPAKPQSRAKVPQSRSHVPQSRAKAPQSRATAPSIARPRQACQPSKGWKACVKFLRNDRADCSKRAKSQLIRVIACSALWHGMEAEVNWYTGGNAYVQLPTAVAVAMPGVYLVKATWSHVRGDDGGPDSPVASIDHLRWLGTALEILEMTEAFGKELGKKQYDRLVEMLTFNCDSPSDDLEE